MHCETVRIKDGEGHYLTINKDDYDPSIHDLYVEPGVKSKRRR